MKNITHIYRKYCSYTSRLFRIQFAVLLVCLLLLWAADTWVGVADVLNRTLCQGVRVLFGSISALVAFSVGEVMLFLIPTALTFVLVWIFVRTKDHTAALRVVSVVLAALMYVLTMQILTLGIAYRTTPLDEKLHLQREKVTAEELLPVATYLRDEAHTLLDEMSYAEDGSSVMPYDMDTLSQKLTDAYETMSARYPDIVQTFPCRIKPIAASRVMSYIRLSGAYSFFSGDANLNADATDYNFPFTSAHEFAHQRGIAHEDAANFTAYLVCISSADAYVRYSGYVNLLVYVLNAYHTAAGQDAYRAFYGTIDARIQREFFAESRHLSQYETSVGKLSEKVNDLYLKANGTEGAASYGFVVDLAVAFYRDTVTAEN